MTESPKLKRSRTESTPQQPAIWFLLMVTQEDESNAAYRVPLTKASAKAVMEAVELAHKLDTGKDYPEVAVALANAILVLLRDDGDPEELREYYGLVDGRWDPRPMTDFKPKLPDDFKPLDLSALAAERESWEAVCGGPANWADKLSDCSDKPTIVYQVALLHGWC